MIRTDLIIKIYEAFEGEMEGTNYDNILAVILADNMDNNADYDDEVIKKVLFENGELLDLFNMAIENATKEVLHNEGLENYIDFDKFLDAFISDNDYDFMLDFYDNSCRYSDTINKACRIKGIEEI